MSNKEIEEFLHYCKTSRLLIIDLDEIKSLSNTIADLINQPILEVANHYMTIPKKDVVYVYDNKVYTTLLISFDFVIKSDNRILKNREGLETKFDLSAIEVYSRKLKLEKILLEQ